MNPQASADIQRIYAYLMRGFNEAGSERPEVRWDWLAAAHVAVQVQYSLHWRVHFAMLRFALHTHDYPEAAGQVFRLALVPLGHVSGRLPAGNIGRATVNAFQPMKNPERIDTLLLAARQDATREKC